MANYLVDKVTKWGDGSFGITVKEVESGRKYLHVGQKSYLRPLLKRRYAINSLVIFM